MRKLGDAHPGWHAFPKLARLDAATRAGLPVPPGYGFDEPSDAASTWAALVDAHPGFRDSRTSWIARMATTREDGSDRSDAGAGLSIGGVLDATDLAEAIRRLEAHAQEHRLGPWALLLQVEVPRRHLVVAARPAETRDRVQHPVYLEVHDDADTHALSAGRDPGWAGPLRAWPNAARDSLSTLIERAAELHVQGEHGLDLECVVDPDGAVWLVQARPLAAALCPGWDAFSDAVDADADIDVEWRQGIWELDVEHNPTPLSTAHRWLLDTLRTARPGRAGDPTALAGWLYTRSPMLELGARSSPAGDGHVHDPRATWRALQHEWLPTARRACREIAAASSAAPDEELPGLLDQALAAFLSMIDRYLGRLIPARRAAGAAMTSAATSVTTDGRQQDLDALPATWDLEAASLGELMGSLPQAPRVSADTPREPPREPDSAELLAASLREWDDHLFALGLRPIRLVILELARRTELEDVAFALRPPELCTVLRDPSRAAHQRELALRRRSQRRAWAELSPPATIIDGHPMPGAAAISNARGRSLRGVGFGGDHVGPLAVRRDLADLLARRPSPDAIVCLPTLTTQAAIVLTSLEVRAVCTEYGGALSHGALVARELGLSASLRCTGCTGLADGTHARLHATGQLEPLDRVPDPPT